MKRFYVTERVPCVQIWTYEVEAETEEDAIKQVTDGVAEVVESTIEGHDYEESEYEVEEVIDDDISDIVELDKSYYFKMFDKLLRRREEKIINNSANTNNNFLNK